MIKKNYIFAGFLILILSLSVVAFPLSADAQNSNDKGKPNVVSGIGKVPGKGLYVEVLVEIPEGSDPQDMVAKALARQGAVPIGSQEFKESGLVWNQFQDNDPNNDFVTQNYIPAGETLDGLTALTNTHTTWNSVASSSFEFKLGDPNVTDRCPSLVFECNNGNTFDTNNDVGWVPLTSFTTLGIAVWGTFTDEVDIALNSNRGWTTNGANFDTETVMLHENGHALGLLHSTVEGSVMEAIYDGERRTLSADDIAGVSAIYPAANPPPPSDPFIDITSPQEGLVSGKITINAYVEGVSDPVVKFSLWDTGYNWLRDLGADDDGAPYDVSLHTKTLSEGAYIIKAQLFDEGDLNDILDDDEITIEKAGKGGGDSGGTDPKCPSNGKGNKPGCG